MDEHFGAIRTLPSALEWASVNPALFFQDGRPNVEDLASWLVSGARLLGSDDACLHRLDDWFIVASASDWLAGTRMAHPERELFVQMRAFPEAGQNVVRPEFLIAAFYHSVLVWGPGGVSVVRGAVDPGEAIFGHLSEPHGWSRAIAFRGAVDRTQPSPLRSGP